MQFSIQRSYFTPKPGIEIESCRHIDPKGHHDPVRLTQTLFSTISFSDVSNFLFKTVFLPEFKGGYLLIEVIQKSNSIQSLFSLVTAYREAVSVPAVNEIFLRVQFFDHAVLEQISRLLVQSKFPLDSLTLEFSSQQVARRSLDILGNSIFQSKSLVFVGNKYLEMYLPTMIETLKSPVGFSLKSLIFRCEGESTCSYSSLFCDLNYELDSLVILTSSSCRLHPYTIIDGYGPHLLRNLRHLELQGHTLPVKSLCDILQELAHEESRIVSLVVGVHESGEPDLELMPRLSMLATTVFGRLEFLDINFGSQTSGFVTETVLASVFKSQSLKQCFFSKISEFPGSLVHDMSDFATENRVYITLESVMFPEFLGMSQDLFRKLYTSDGFLVAKQSSQPRDPELLKVMQKYDSWRFTNLKRILSIVDGTLHTKCPLSGLGLDIVKILIFMITETA